MPRYKFKNTLPTFHLIRDGILYRKEGSNGIWYQVGKQVDISGEFTLFSNIEKSEEKLNNNMLPDDLFILE